LRASSSAGTLSISVRSLRAGLVDEVDGLVGQEAVGDVAVRTASAAATRRGVLDAHAVVDLVALPEAAEDGDRCPRTLGGSTRTCWKRRSSAAILLDVLAVLVERGGADAVKLAARQHGLEEVAGVHRALGLAGAHDACASRR
jgi:hypothetical protein